MNFKFLLLVILVASFVEAYAEEEFGTISNGACWFSLDEGSLKIASFNDRSIMKKNLDELSDQAVNLAKEQFKFAQLTQIRSVEMAIHCGAYGSSLVVKMDSSVGDICAWFAVSEKNLSIRSLGFSTKKESGICHGMKVGELIAGITEKDVIESLKSEKYSSMIESLEYVAMNTYKIRLKENFYFKESEVEDYLRMNFDEKKIRYIEFNGFRHPIGDVVKLK